jgi:hypothetical protein
LIRRNQPIRLSKIAHMACRQIAAQPSAHYVARFPQAWSVRTRRGELLSGLRECASLLYERVQCALWIGALRIGALPEVREQRDRLIEVLTAYI